MFLIVLSISFLVLYALLIFYYYKNWKKEPAISQRFQTGKIFMSVLIPARNEENNIPILLNALQRQTLSKEYFEVIVIDDFSTDRTMEVVKNLNVSNTRMIRPESTPGMSSKKKAIEAGIHASTGSVIITTDADCEPPPDWLQCLYDFAVNTDASFIAAPVKFSTDGSLLQDFQALDFLTLQGITAASVRSGFHTMCNGANLGYKKESFLSVNGFEGIDALASGDDMLLMHKIWKKDPSRVHYLKEKKAIVSTGPMKNWRDFFSQRKRWASKTRVYNDSRILGVLLFVFLLNLLFVFLVLYSFFHPQFVWVVAGIWIGKTIIEYPFVSSVARFYDHQRLMRRFFIFQPLHMFYIVFTGLLSQFGGFTWKGRKTK